MMNQFWLNARFSDDSDMIRILILIPLSLAEVGACEVISALQLITEYAMCNTMGLPKKSFNITTKQRHIHQTQMEPIG